MAEGTKIEWCDHTFNPWWGCQRVSPGCQHCYAETLAKRYGHAVWGPTNHSPRRFFGDEHWAEPLKWNRKAEQLGRRARVFCSSMADVFEDYRILDDHRSRLWGLIEATPWLDWLLLTKRPQNAVLMLFDAWRASLPRNLWIGTSVENQAAADERIPELLKVPARVRFLSCEPLLGPVDLSRWVKAGGEPLEWAPDGDSPPGEYNPVLRQWETRPDDGGIDWIVVGGESGAQARPMHPEWARSLRDQSVAAGVAFHFKQHGEWLPKGQGDHGLDERGLFRREAYINGHAYYRVGKARAGRQLDGQEWNEVPQ